MNLRALVVLTFVLGAASAADAQELASSLDQLRVLVKPGDVVTVTDTAGHEMKGSIAELSPTSLVLLVGADRHEVPAADLSVVSQRKPDSLANGAKWGFAVGAGLGLLAFASIASEYEGADVGWGLAAVLLYGGIGSGVGVGLDAMISSDQVIFARRGVAVSLKF